jgi:3-hydroxy-9,10-secoandrosta-1,3,5(10)-triene-9,17-dione monooxygenase reductase component
VIWPSVTSGWPFEWSAQVTTEFRNVLGHFPTGVTVVATMDGARPVGLAVGSFFSVSLEPPMVGFCVMTTSSTWPLIEQCGRFGVSVLAGEQTDICQRLATKDRDKFSGLHWSPAPVTGSLLIDGAVAHFDCTLEQQHLAGDHWIVVGHVAHLNLHRVDADPMVFCRGGYGRFAV